MSNNTQLCRSESHKVNGEAVNKRRIFPAATNKNRLSSMFGNKKNNSPANNNNNNDNKPSFIHVPMAPNRDQMLTRSLSLPSKLINDLDHCMNDDSIHRIDPHKKIVLGRHLPFLSDTTTTATRQSSASTEDMSSHSISSSEDENDKPQLEVDNFVREVEKSFCLGGDMISSSPSSMRRNITIPSRKKYLPAPDDAVSDTSERSGMNSRTSILRPPSYSPKMCPVRSSSVRLFPRKVSFSNNVKVTEFHRSDDEIDYLPHAWFTEAELEACKQEALRAILSKKRIRRHSFCEGEDLKQQPVKVVNKNTPAVQNFAKQEIHSILLVNSHPIFLQLLSRDIKSIFPHSKVLTACSVFEALDSISISRSTSPSPSNLPVLGYDVIVIEDKLKQCKAGATSTSVGGVATQHCFAFSPLSVTELMKMEDTFQTDLDEAYSSVANGMELLEFLNSQQQKQQRTNASSSQEIFSLDTKPQLKKSTLFIGVSTMKENSLKVIGADLVWNLPPPLMDDSLKSEITLALMKKRSM